MTELSYIAMFFSILGNVFVNRKNVLGMYLWTIGSALWIIFAIYHHTWSQVVMFAVYLLLNVDGIWRWRKGDTI